MKDDEQSLAMRYALGVADEAEIAAAAARLDADPVFRGLVERYDELFACLDDDIVAVEPPASLWSRIDSAISALDASPAPSSGISWESVGPGVECRVLRVDQPGLASATLFRLSPGASLPAQLGSDTSLLLRGEVEIGGQTLAVFGQPAPCPALSRASAFSRTGAIIYSRAG